MRRKQSIITSRAMTSLRQARPAIEDALAEVRLQIHPIKSQLFETRPGPSFLGFRILPTQIRVRANNLRRARQRFRLYQALYHKGELN
jgi:hypothetical protein